MTWTRTLPNRLEPANGEALDSWLEALAQIGLPSNRAVFDEITDRAVTLVKNVDPTILPVTPARYQRILVVPVKGPENAAAVEGCRLVSRG